MNRGGDSGRVHARRVLESLSNPPSPVPAHLDDRHRADAGLRLGREHTKGMRPTERVKETVEVEREVSHALARWKNTQ